MRQHTASALVVIKAGTVNHVYRVTVILAVVEGSDVQVWHQRLSSAFDLLLISIGPLIQTLTLTTTPNNALLANRDM